MASQTHSVPTISDGSRSGGHPQHAAGAYPASASYSPSAVPAAQAYKRLVVLAPEGAIDHGKLVQALSGLMTPSVCEVVFVGLGPRRPSSPASRRVAELASMTQDLLVTPSKRVLDASSWAEAVQMIAQPGDLIVCQPDRYSGWQLEEFAQVTALPVHLLPGLQLSVFTRLVRALKGLMFNLFPFVLVAAFFWLQVQIDAQNTGPIRTLILSMSVLVELGIIFVWSLFIR